MSGFNRHLDTCHQKQSTAKYHRESMSEDDRILPPGAALTDQGHYQGDACVVNLLLSRSLSPPLSVSCILVVDTFLVGLNTTIPLM
jgi:hypothetical protein